MRCFVTGGTGFIGSNLSLRLEAEGHDVIITSRGNEQNLVEFKGKQIQSPLTDVDFNGIGKIDVLFHQAAINDPTFLDREELFRVNVEYPKKLFRKAVENDCQHIVYASSTATYGNAPVPYKENGPMYPLNPYSESKRLLDEFAMAFAEEHKDVSFVGLRYCNVYGPREKHKKKYSSMIYQFAQQMIKGNPKLFKYGQQKRDFIYVEDVVEANLLAAQARESFIVNCGFGKATKFNDLVHIINNVLRLNRVPEYIDNPYIDRYQTHTQCDMTLAKQKLGFIPRFDIESGIKAYYETGFLVER